MGWWLPDTYNDIANYLLPSFQYVARADSMYVAALD